ncbi:glutathione S-transferase N-terminal domain-containing protein [Suttonella indologenes]|uniref:Stringent starvation protein A homolog n=1 Tax=Suttonella indologenes TaxID=13276 RepID=A0A380MIN8_9GAMM|nr:glutathione S-transferase N-terminal domain-containing protein [Suttonella indologenes]SUO92036.1 Stringent starvation protein A homolog [Suttonella indologenes]
MSIVSQKRGGLALVSSPKYISSHRIRLVSYAKDLEIDYIEVDADNLPEDLLEINPSGRLPTLFDRNLVLINDRVISEYLDERFPHPALMPIEAELRAKIRLFGLEIEAQWYDLVNQLEHEKLSPAKKKAYQKTLREQIVQFSPMIKNSHYIIGQELSLLDCCILPVLWRLQHLEIDLPKNAFTQSLFKYMDFHFKQEYFKKALSKYEAGLRPEYVL